MFNLGRNPGGALIDTERYPYLRYKFPSNVSRDWKTFEEMISTWHKRPELLTNAAKNLAWKVQDETQEAMCNFIEKACQTPL